MEASIDTTIGKWNLSAWEVTDGFMGIAWEPEKSLEEMNVMAVFRQPSADKAIEELKHEVDMYGN